MKTLLVTILSLAIVACGRFSQDQLLTENFGVDLQSLSSSKKTEYSDGLFLVFDVSDVDPIYAHFFTKPHEEKSVTILFGEIQFDSSEVGIIRYHLLGSIDGYTKTVFDVPEKKMMGFGYSDGLL